MLGREGYLTDSCWFSQTRRSSPVAPLPNSSLNAKVNLPGYLYLDFFWCPGADKSPLERSKLLETTSLFANIHAEAASSGQTSVPVNLDTDLHFTCFVQAPEAASRETETPTKTMRLIELDGRRAGPVDRGECTNLLAVSIGVYGAMIQDSHLFQW